MAHCEICGTDAALVPAVIEHVEVDACRACARFGTVRQKQNVKQAGHMNIRAASRQRGHQAEPIPTIVNDCAQRIKRRRERLGLTQAELAKKLAERESVISALESGTMEPSVALAQKIERALSIRLIETEEQKSPGTVTHQKSEGMTLGDLIKKG